MPAFDHLGRPLKLLASFLALAGLPLAALGWLGWRLLEQDRALDAQRLRDRLEYAASVLVREFDHDLINWDERLAGAGHHLSAPLPASAVLLIFNDRGVIRQHGERLPYYPLIPASLEAPASMFAQAEDLEFRQTEFAKASALYRDLAATPDRPQRAAALVRLARCLRKQGRLHEALVVYSDLAGLGDTLAGGAPAGLVGLRERIVLLKSMANDVGAQREISMLGSVLREGRVPIDRATFDFYLESAPAAGSPSQQTRSLTSAVERFWPQWQRQPSGKAALTSGGIALATVWRPIPEGTAAIVMRLDDLILPLVPVMNKLQIRMALQDPAGTFAWGNGKDRDYRVEKTDRETRLPWTIRVAAAESAVGRGGWKDRRNLLALGFALMAIVIATACYFVFRAVQRELAVARLQADFVSAVSHEFRTPLTAMCHISEILEEGSATADSLPKYYRALGAETRRLHRMVESLLDFGRMEAGRHTYNMEDTSATSLVRRVVDEFRNGASGGARRLDLQTPAGDIIIHADTDSIALALRNLLDNAIKYSPECSPVTLSVEDRGELVGISIADEGPGIATEEQREVFRKFVRGKSAKDLNVKGTGLGLTMADRIARAHGGWVELDSEPDRGSRFTILLPAREHRS